MVALLRAALAQGRAELARRLAAHPAAGHEIAHGHAFLADQLIRVIHDHVLEHLYPVANRSTGERLALIAVGGYGRGEMAPHSDIDIAFITPAKPTSLVRTGDRGDALLPVGLVADCRPFQPLAGRNGAAWRRMI